jgi:ribonuclease P protein component
LTEKHSFSNVFAKTAYAKKTRFFSVLATSGAAEQARLGIIVAKKNVRLAVDRNKIKRVIRETFRLQQEALVGLDVVVIVKKNFDTLDAEKQRLPLLLQQISKAAKCCKK